MIKLRHEKETKYKEHMQFWIGSVYFAAKMSTATAWLKLLCRQSET